MKPTCSANIARLEVGDVVAGEADAILLVAHRDQDAPELAHGDEARQQHGAEQKKAADEIEDVFRAVWTDVPAEQRAQVGDAVDAAGVALPADNQDGQHGRQRLGDDGEVDAAHSALEHRGAEDERGDRRHREHGEQRERQRLERDPEERQLRELVPVHEIGDAGGRLDLGVGDARRLELEKSRHAVAAEPEEYALPQAQDPGMAPAQHQADRDECVGQVLADEIEPEDVERQRQHDQDQQRDQGKADQLERAGVGADIYRGACRHRGTTF